MKQTISISLSNRYGDAERIIGLFSATGYRIEKMTLTKEDAEDISKLTVVTDTAGKNVSNFLTRLRQQVRVSEVDCVEGENI